MTTCLHPPLWALETLWELFQASTLTKVDGNGAEVPRPARAGARGCVCRRTGVPIPRSRARACACARADSGATRRTPQREHRGEVGQIEHGRRKAFSYDLGRWACFLSLCPCRCETRVHTHAHMRMYLDRYLHLCMHVCMSARVRACMHACMHACNMCIWVYAYLQKSWGPGIRTVMSRLAGPRA